VCIAHPTRLPLGGCRVILLRLAVVFPHDGCGGDEPSDGGDEHDPLDLLEFHAAGEEEDRRGDQSCRMGTLFAHADRSTCRWK